MKPIRNALSLLFAATLCTFALSAIAAKPQQQGQAKSYQIEFLLPSTLPQTDPNGTQNPSYGTNGQLNAAPTVILWVKNESPPSTAASNISSLTFTVSGLTLIGQPTCPRAICSADPGTGTITLTNISPPIQGQETYPITFQVNTCVVAGDAAVNTFQAFTGSSPGSGQPFSPFAGDLFFTPAPVLSTREPFDNFTTKTTPVVTTGISCGTADCSVAQSIPVPNFDPASHPSSVVTLVRGLNADGSCNTSTGLPYFLTNELTAVDNPTAHTTWPRDATSPAVFAYELTREPNTGSDWHIGWLPSGQQAVPIDPALTPCTLTFPSTSPPTSIDQLPLPKVLGFLTADVKPNATKIKVDTSPTFTGNFPIMVETEWMLVTGISNGTWTVTRPFASSRVHSAGLRVASTPMQLLPPSVAFPYQSGQVAQMCVAWNNGTSIWVIDGSDGWTFGK